MRRSPAITAASSFSDNSTGGSAKFITNAGGVVDFSGSTGPNNDNKLSAGSIAGAGDYYLGLNALTIGGNNLDTTVSGVISDCGATGTECNNLGATGGSLVKTGTGTMTLSGANTYTGAATINGGTVLVDGTVVGPAIVNNGGTFGGIGNVGTTTVNSGATLLPGAVGTVGTLTVNGNLSFGPGANYVVFMTPTTIGRTNVSGTATLGGTVFVNGQTSQAYRAGSYSILNAAGGFGGSTFSTLNVLGTFGTRVRNPHLAYDADDVFLVLDQGLIVLPRGANGNQTNVANGINNAILGGADPNSQFNTLLGYSGAQLTAALNQLTGQAATGGTTGGVQMMNAFLSLLLNPYGGAPGGNPGALGFARDFGAGEKTLSPEAAAAYAAVTPADRRVAANDFASRWGLWGAGYGGYNETGGDAAAGTNDVTARTWGLAVGADYRVSANTMLGFALAGGSMNWGLSENLGGGKSDVFQLGAYGSHSFGAAYVSAALSYAWHSMTTDRTVTAVGSEQLRATFDAHNFGGRLETGYRFATPYVGITPYAAAQAQWFHTPSYSESATSGPGAFALSYDQRNTTATRFELGSWFDKSFLLAGGNVLALRGRAAWAHDHSTDNSINAVFQTLPGSGFTVNGAASPSNLALVSAGAEYRLANNVTIGAKFDGEFAARSQTYAGTGVIRYAW